MTWLLIQPNEDGNPCSWLDESGLRSLLIDPGNWGVRTFLTEVPAETDSNYWPDGSALLLKVEVRVPQPVTVPVMYELPEG